MVTHGSESKSFNYFNFVKCLEVLLWLKKKKKRHLKVGNCPFIFFYFLLSFLEHGLDLQKVVLPIYLLHLCDRDECLLNPIPIAAISCYCFCMDVFPACRTKVLGREQSNRALQFLWHGFQASSTCHLNMFATVAPDQVMGYKGQGLSSVICAGIY